MVKPLPVIYALCQPETGEVRYVGKTSSQLQIRYSRHMCNAKTGNAYVHNWIRSLTEKPHVVVLEENPSNLDTAEMQWIAFYREILGDRLCNLTVGGDGGPGYRHTAESLEKMRVAATGRHMSVEAISKTRAAHVGSKRSDETKAAMSAMRTGRTLSAEHRAKIGSAQIGKIVSEETRMKMSIARRRYYEGKK